MKKLVRLGDYIREYSVRNKSGENIPVYSVTNIQGFCRDYFGKEVASKDKSTYKIVPKGFFAYNPSRINVGSVDWQRNEEQVLVSPLYNVFSVSNELNQQYLYYYLKSDLAQHRIKVVATGSVRDNLKLDMLYEFQITLPDLKEQKIVVEVLDRVKKIITYRSKELETLDTLIKARFVEMFGDPIENPMKWEQEFLSSKIEIIGGYAFKSENFDTKEGIPILRIGNINSGYFRPNNLVFWKEDKELARYLVYPGDLVMSLTGTVGKSDYANVCIVGEEYPKYYLNQRNAKLKLKDGLNKYYLAELLRFEKVKEKITSINRGVRQANISNRDILDLIIPVPRKENQNQFSDFVTQVDKSKVVS